MALLGREFIAVPDDKKHQIVFKWPDHNIRKFTRAIVNADEMAMFVNTGKVVATMGRAATRSTPTRSPGSASSSTTWSAATSTRPSCTSCGTREYPGNNFGGRIDDVQDPQTGMIVTLRVFGDYSMKVKDPVALITNLVGTVDVANNERHHRLDERPAPQGHAHPHDDPDRPQRVAHPRPVGLHARHRRRWSWPRATSSSPPTAWPSSGWATSTSTCPSEDEAQLKTLAKDTAYSRLAGSFSQYAAGEMALGAGQGMAQGGGGVGGAFLAAGLGLGGQAAAPAAPGPPPPPGAGLRRRRSRVRRRRRAAGVECPNCHAGNAAGAKFCASCGTSLAPPAANCPSCQAENPPAAKFCASAAPPWRPPRRTAPRAGPRWRPAPSSARTAVPAPRPPRGR